MRMTQGAVDYRSTIDQKAGLQQELPPGAMPPQQLPVRGPGPAGLVRSAAAPAGRAAVRDAAGAPRRRTGPRSGNPGAPGAATSTRTPSPLPRPPRSRPSHPRRPPLPPPPT